MITERGYQPDFIEEVELQLDRRVKTVAKQHRLPRVVCVMMTQFDGKDDQVFTGSYLVPEDQDRAVRVVDADLPSGKPMADYLRSFMQHLPVAPALIIDTKSMSRLRMDNESLVLLGDDTGALRLLGLLDKPLTVFLQD